MPDSKGRTGVSVEPLLPKLKVRVTALHQHNDRLYAGTGTGQVQVYSFSIPEGEIKPQVKLLKSHNVAKKAVEAICILESAQKLAILTDGIVQLYALPDLTKPHVLTQAKSALSIAAWSGAEKEILVVGCKKKVVVFGAGSKGLKEAWELTLPHSPRRLIIPSTRHDADIPSSIFLLYSTDSSALLHLHSHRPHLTISELSQPSFTQAGSSSDHPKSSSQESQNPTGSGGSGSGGSGLSMGVSALSGLGGYVGLGAKNAGPVGTNTAQGEVFLYRDDTGLFYNTEGKVNRTDSLRSPSHVEALAFSNPNIYSITTQAATSSSSSPFISLQVHLSPTLHPSHTVTIPNPSTGGLSATSLIPITSSKSTLASDVAASTKALFITSPSDRNLAASEGSSIWAITSGDLGEEVDDLVRQGRVHDAIGLVEAVGETGFAPSRRLPHLKVLRAVQNFSTGQFQSAMEVFVQNDINPALVISLYPEASISGRLHVPRAEWLKLFGAIEGARLVPEEMPTKEVPGKGLLNRVTQVSERTSSETLRSNKEVQEEPTSAQPTQEDVSTRPAMEALMYFLSDRRQKLNAPMANTAIPQESSLPPLSTLSAEKLHSLPSGPFTEIDPETLLRMAQVIYTALIKVYLVARPILVGSLCRIENWCDVEEVEGLLKGQKKFGDLIDLYQGKKMHKKALSMLHELAMQEDDKLDRYPPTIEYLQKLGPEELPLIFESSTWIFQEDPHMGLKIFTADKAEVEALPRLEVMRFLNDMDVDACIEYLNHVIADLGDTNSDLHDKLVELYLSKADKDGSAALLDFLNISTNYRPYRLLSKIPENLPEAKAILLGRIGRHEEALRIYVYKLENYTAAETYCAKVYASEPDPKGIFLLLLRIYLRPSPSEPVLLEPALSLIITHGTRLDPEQVLDLLPPLVTMKHVQDFFIKTLRDGLAKKNDAMVIRHLIDTRKNQTERVLMDLEMNKVRITDQRICPQCHKRLGTSAIAVHAPRGEVTHLHCKDTFNATLNAVRG